MARIATQAELRRYRALQRDRSGKRRPKLGGKRGSRKPLALVACLAAALAVCGACWNALGQGGVPVAAGEGVARSTPKSEWRRGTVPYLYQTDPAWVDEPYAGSDVAEAGCGPTALAMVYVSLTGRTDLDPAQMAAFSESEGHVADGMTAWTLMTDGAEKLGLTSRELPADAGIVRATLRQGMPVIASVRPGDFTTTGHFIVIAGVDENGDLVVHDPNSPERSGRTWDAQRVVNQCSNLWGFSA